MNDLKQHFFTEESFEKIEKELLFIIEELPIVVVEDNSTSYSYGEPGFSKERPAITAHEWLGVFPDLPDD